MKNDELWIDFEVSNIAKSLLILIIQISRFK